MRSSRGELSPVRHLARRPVNRAAVIRRGIAELGDRYRAEVWAWWNNNAGIWEVDFERLDGGPTITEFTAAIAQHPSLRDHHQAIAVATEAGAALRWARAMRLPGAAVILDTETTDLDGYVVEVAVLDAATGDVLLDTLVNPGCPVQPAARWVHGIGDDQLASSPPLAEVWPRLLEATAGRTVLAYNAFTSQADCRERVCREQIPLGSVPGVLTARLPGHRIMINGHTLSPPLFFVAANLSAPSRGPGGAPAAKRGRPTGRSAVV